MITIRLPSTENANAPPNNLIVIDRTGPNCPNSSSGFEYLSLENPHRPLEVIPITYIPTNVIDANPSVNQTVVSGDSHPSRETNEPTPIISMIVMKNGLNLANLPPWIPLAILSNPITADSTITLPM